VKPKKLTALFMIVAGIPLLSIGFYVLRVGVNLVIDTFHSRSWEHVPANILYMQPQKKEGQDSNVYKVNVKFSYNYNGIKYTGERFYLADITILGNIGDKIIDHASMIKEVQQDPVYCIVNPENPSEAVLFNSFTNLVSLIIPFALFFTIIGVSVTLGQGLSLWEQIQIHNFYRSTGNLRPNRLVSSFTPLAYIPGWTCAIVFILNLFFLNKSLGPENAFYIGTGLLITGFLTGWRFTSRYLARSDVVLLLKNLPGRQGPFEVELMRGKRSRTSNQEDAARGDLNVTNARVELLSSPPHSNDDSEQERILATFGLKSMDSSPGRWDLVIDLKNINIKDIPQRYLEPGSSSFLGKISKKYKDQLGGLLYRHGFKIAKNMKLALLGGPQAGEAAHQVKNLLATKRWEFYIHLVLEIKKHEVEIVLPPDIWAS
jgi:hypothetical protein